MINIKKKKLLSFIAPFFLVFALLFLFFYISNFYFSIFKIEINFIGVGLLILAFIEVLILFLTYYKDLTGQEGLGWYRMFIFCLFMIVFGLSFQEMSFTPSSKLFWNLVTKSGALLLPIGFLVFSVILSKEKSLRDLIVDYWFIPVTLAFLVLSVSNAYFSNLFILSDELFSLIIDVWVVLGVLIGSLFLISSEKQNIKTFGKYLFLTSIFGFIFLYLGSLSEYYNIYISETIIELEAVFLVVISLVLFRFLFEEKILQFSASDNISLLINNINESLVVTDENYQVLFANSYFKEDFAFKTKDSIYGKSVLEVFKDRFEDFEEFETNLKKVHEDQPEMELVISSTEKAGGNKKYLRIKFIKNEVPVHSEATYLLVIDNVTKLKKSEHREAEQKEKFKSYIQKAPHGVFSIDKKGAFLSVNPRFCSLMNSSKSELLNKNLKEVIKIEDDPDFCNSALNLEEGEKLEREVTCSKNKFAQLTLVRLTKDKFLGYCVDVTKTIKREKKLERFKLAVDNADVGIVMTDKNNDIIYVNKKWESNTGYKLEEVKGEDPSILKSGESPKGVYEEMWEKLSNNEVFETDKLIDQRKDGTTFNVNLMVYPVVNRNNEVEFYVGILKDISDRKKLEKSRKEFISTAAHQLKSPVSSLRWVVDTLLGGQDIENLTENQKEYLYDLETIVKNINELVNSLLNISRIESGRVSVEREDVRLRNLIDEIKEDQKNYMEAKNCDFNFESNFEKIIRSDSNLLRQVLTNLINNALKYSTNECKIDVKVENKEDTVIISVSDKGIGIPEEEQDQLFQRFYRAENAKKIDTSGTGLGLNISKTIVELLEGKIWFESEEGEGSTFYVQLPKTTKEKEGEVKIEETKG